MIIGDFLSKYWKNSWVLVASRLTKSGIEYVILAGSSIFELSEAKSGFLLGLGHYLARAARDFFNDFDFLAPKTQKFCSPAGATV